MAEARTRLRADLPAVAPSSGEEGKDLLFNNRGVPRFAMYAAITTQ